MIETAQQRYRLRRDTMFSESPQGIYFSNSTSGFEICGANAYRAFRAVYPLLEGEHTEDELREALGEEAWERLQVFIVPLREHGYLRLVDPCEDVVLDGATEMRFDDQLNFLSHYTDEPRRAFSRFRSAPLIVVGDGECARALVRALTDNGAGDVRLVLPTADAETPVDAPPQVRIVRGDPRTDHEILRGAQVLVLTPCAASSDLLLHGVDEEPDRLVLPVWAFGDELIAGPVNWGGAGSRGPRWADAVQSLTTHDTDSAGSLFWSRAWAGMPTGREATWVPAVERMIAVIAAFEVFKAVTGAMEPETGESILVLDCRTGETRRHRVLPNRLLRTAPRNPVRLAEMARAAAESLAGPPAPTARILTEDLDAYKDLVGARTRPVSEFLDEDLEQLPLKISAARLVDGPPRPVDVGGADLWNVAGARLDAVRRALALHLEHWAPAREAEPPSPRPVIDSLDSRLRHDLEPTGPTVPAVDVSTGGALAVRAAATATLSPANSASAYVRSCGGTGVGHDVREAVEDALASAAVELALRAATTDGAGAPLPDWDADEQTAFLHSCARDLTVVPEVIDLGTWLGRHVVAARADSPSGPLWEAAAGDTRRSAVAAALTGLIGALQRGDGTGTWTSLSHPGLTGASIAVAEDGAPAAHEPRILICDITSPELDAVGLVACKVLTEDAGEETAR